MEADQPGALSPGHCYNTGHKHSDRVMTAFAAGSGLPLSDVRTLKPGFVATYGALRGANVILARARREGREWLYLDRPYFGPRTDEGYYRATWNALQHDGSGEAGPERWERLGLKLAPWRNTGKHIVVCPPGRLFGQIFGFDADQWLRITLKILRTATVRHVVVREKMSWSSLKAMHGSGSGRTLQDDLKGAWALVAHSSNAAVEAVIAGIPVFCTDPCGAYRMGLSDLRKIESPVFPDRQQWAWNLAANQWTLAELQDGTAWRALKR